MSKKKPFKVEGREFGRGPKWTDSFATLAEAQAHVKSHWQGAEYIDGPQAFHTDYSTFTLVGFSLRDIGTFYTEDDGCPNYRFSQITVLGTTVLDDLAEFRRRNPDLLTEDDA